MSDDLWPNPSSPHSFNDEFNTDSSANWILTGWTAAGAVDPYATISSGSVGRLQISTYRPGWMCAQVPLSAGPVLLTKPFAAPTDCIIWSRIGSGRYTSIPDDQGNIMLTVTAEASGNPDINNGVFIGIESDTNSYKLEFGRWNNGSYLVATSGPASFVPEYVGLQKTGSSYRGWAIDVSGDVLDMGSLSLSMTVEHAGYRLNDATTGVNSILQSGFIRVYTDASFFPLSAIPA